MAIIPYTTIKKELLIDHKFLRLIHEDFETSTGERSEYFYQTSNDGVHCVGIDSARENFVLTKQYRHPIKSIEIDVAGGVIEDGEEIEQAVYREFFEETGYKGKKLVKLGKTAVATAKADNWLHEFLWFDVERVGEINNPDSAEETEVFLLPIDKAWDLVKSSELASPHTFSTIVKALLYLEIQP
jgi:ADP-ribose pyrophosphatase